MDPMMNSPFLGNLGGNAGGNEVDELIKAINAGSSSDPNSGSFGSGNVLIPQSLEQTLVVTTFNDKHIKLWKDIPKEAAFNTVEEYDRLESYGPERLSAFMPEGDLPFSDDASYSRQNAIVKYMGTLRAVSHPMGLVRSIAGDQVAKETQNGTLWLMRQLERALFFGNSALVPTQFDGLLSQLTAAIAAGACDAAAIIDRRSSVDVGLGKSLNQYDLDNASEQVYGNQNFGMLDTLYYGTTAHKNLGQGLIQGEGGSKGAGIRLDVQNNKGGEIVPGWKFKSVATMFGDLTVNPDVFLNPVSYTAAQLTAAAFAQGDASTRPDVPTQGNTAEQNTTDSQWGTQTGNYKYIVVAVNKFGNSVGTASKTGVVTGATKSMRIDITKGSVVPTGYVLYRTAVGGDAFYEIARFGYTSGLGGAGAGQQYFYDTNSVIAGTSYAFAMQMGKDVLSFKQLAPFMRVPLATIDMRTRWVQLLYGTPVLKAPRKMVIFKNVL